LVIKISNGKGVAWFSNTARLNQEEKKKRIWKKLIGKRQRQPLRVQKKTEKIDP